MTASAWQYYVTTVTNRLNHQRDYVVVSTRRPLPRVEEMDVATIELDAGPFQTRDEAREWIEEQKRSHHG